MKKPHIESIENEIRKEKAEALGRTGERLEEALQELKILRREIRGLVWSSLNSVPDTGEGIPAEIRERLLQYARLREQACQWRHCLVVQREAVGLWRHEDVERMYPVPPPLTLPMLTHREDGQ
jgi:hypothetical protein